MRRIFAVLLLLGFGLEAAAKDDWGVLVMAHGGNPAWNATVADAVKGANLAVPAEVFFGMAAMEQEGEALAAALLRLKKKGSRRILAVPLLVSSHSEVYRQYQYMLGLSTAPGFTQADLHLMAGMHGGGHGHAGHPRLPEPPRLDGTPVFLTKALDDSPELARVLADRLAALSRAPAAEAVIFVAHGPNDERDNGLWEEGLRRLAEAACAGKPFAGKSVVTLREDAAPEIKDAATRRLRETAESYLKAGRRVLVAPVLVSAGGIERGVADRLKGLDVEIGKPILPHPAVSDWIRRKAAETPR